MIAVRCEALHARPRGELCAECAELAEYARRRLERCPFGPDKPTCQSCRVHCYRPTAREQMREVMRFSGPRMPQRHPYLALTHLLVDARRPTPERPGRRSAPTPVTD